MSCRVYNTLSGKDKKCGDKLSSNQPSTKKHLSFDAKLRNFQREIGNQAFGRLIQHKLKVGRHDDPLEQEADRVAGEVFSPSFFSHSYSLGNTIHPYLSENVSNNQQSPSHKEGISIPMGIEKQIGSLQGGGVPLHKSEQAYFEKRLGQDLSDVRLYTSQPAAMSAEAINARAYTFKNNIVFDKKGYHQGIDSDRKLLAHELVHVIQQRGNLSQDHKIQGHPNNNSLVSHIFNGMGTQIMLQQQTPPEPRFPDMFGFAQRLKYDIDTNLFDYRHHFMQALTLSEANPHIMEDTFERFAFGRNVLESSIAYLGVDRDTAEILSYAGGLSYLGAKFLTEGEVEMDFQLPINLNIPGVSRTLLEFNLTFRTDPVLGEAKEAHTEDVRLQGGLGAGNFIGAGLVGVF